MNTPRSDATPARRRRALAVGGAALVVAVLAVLGGVLSGGSGSGDSADAAAGATASSSISGTASPATSSSASESSSAGGGTAASTAQPTGPTSDVNEPPPSLPAVALDRPAAVGNGVIASIVSMDAVHGTGTGPGNITGPALRVTVQLANGTAAPVSLDGVAVNLASGSDLTPASPLNDPSSSPFTGAVEPGGSARGVYVFSIPEEARGSVTVSVGYQAGAPILVFTGAAR